MSENVTILTTDVITNGIDTYVGRNVVCKCNIVVCIDSTYDRGNVIDLIGALKKDVIQFDVFHINFTSSIDATYQTEALQYLHAVVATSGAAYVWVNEVRISNVKLHVT